MAAAVLVLTTALAVPVAAQTPAPLDAESATAATETMIRDHIRPGYQRLLNATEAAARDIADLCETPSDRTLSQARTSFGDVVRAWSWIAHIRFGPAGDANRHESIHFWPDPRGIGLRQIQRALAGADDAVLEPKTFADQSVALQGLGALEFVLFGTGADDLASPPAAGYRCRFAAAIVANLVRVATAIDSAWADPDGYAKLLREPGPDNPLHRDAGEVLSEYIGTLAHGLEAIRDQKLLPVLGSDAASAKPKRAVFYRSDLTGDALAGEFAGLAHMFEASGLTLLLPDEERWMGDSALFEFRNAARTIDEIGDDFGAAALDEDKGRGKLTYLVILTRSLQTLIGEDMSGMLGLAVGFSSLDGD